MDNKRFLEIDLIKIISCLAVIAIHTSARGVTEPAAQETVRNISMFFNGLSNFAVPSFIFLSGLALMLRYGNKPLSILDFVRKRMKSILIPYLFWSFIYFYINVRAGYYAIDLNNILSVIFLGTGEYHLYFVVILFQLYLLFPFLKLTLERMGPLIGLASVLVLHLAFSYRIAPFPYMDRFFVPYLIFFVPGMIWGAQYENMKNWMQKNRGLTGTLYVLLTGAYLYSRFNPEAAISRFPQLWQLFSLASILILMGLTTSLVPKVKTPEQISATVTFSAATFYVYLAHPLIITYFYKICADAGHTDLKGILPAAYVLAAGIPFFGALVYLKLKDKIKAAVS